MNQFSRAGVPDPLPMIEQVKNTYRKNGYTSEKNFPKEYYFMHNPDTGECVRLYYNGRVHEYRE